MACRVTSRFIHGRSLILAYQVIPVLSPRVHRWYIHWILVTLDSLLPVGNAENKVNNDGQQQNDGQESRSIAIVESGLSSPSYRARTPVVGDESIYHGEHRHTGEEEC